VFQYDGKCPQCHSEKAVVKDNFIDCGQCGLKGDLGMMRFCEKVPVFDVVKKEDVYAVKAQTYVDKYGETWTLEGYAPGCGRPVVGDFCTSCRGSLPLPSEKPKRKGKRSAREDDGVEA
jgi:transcription elongation factor Elf1